MNKTFRALIGLIMLSTLTNCNTKKHNSDNLMTEKKTESMQKLADNLYSKLEVLRPQSIRPAVGFFEYDYLIPAGFYSQMWDWDGYFIGSHLSSRSKDEAKYLKYWAVNFINGIDEEGYVAGCLTEKGNRPIFGKFAMKPFLNQGVYFYSERVGDYAWIAPYYDRLKLATDYREKTQFDAHYGLYFWDNAMQSGADDNVVLTNDNTKRSSIIGADISTFQYSEFVALSKIALKLGHKEDAAIYAKKGADLKANMLMYLWDETEKSFWNIYRETGEQIKRVSYSNFIPLTQNIVNKADGIEMIKRYLWNENHMLGKFGLRTLSKQDTDYNNDNIIIPYSNWRGPVWPVANYLYFIALKNYGFDKEVIELTEIIGTMLVQDIEACGSMHENYHADSGASLAPTAEQSKNGIFTGFVGWNMLSENMFRGVLDNEWLLLTVD